MGIDAMQTYVHRNKQTNKNDQVQGTTKKNRKCNNDNNININ